MTTDGRHRKSTLSKITKLFVADSNKNNGLISEQPPINNNNNNNNNNKIPTSKVTTIDTPYTTRSSSNSSRASTTSTSSSSLHQLAIDDFKNPHPVSLASQHQASNQSFQHHLIDQQPQQQSSSQVPSRVPSKYKKNHSSSSSSNEKLSSQQGTFSSVTTSPHLSRSSSSVSHNKQAGANSATLKQVNSTTSLLNLANSIAETSISNNSNTASSQAKHQARFIVFEDGTHEHHLKNAKRQEKLTNMFKSLLTNNGNKLRDEAVSAVPEILNSGPPSLFSGLFNQQQQQLQSAQGANEKYPFSGATRVYDAKDASNNAHGGVSPVTDNGNCVSFGNNQTFVERYGRCQETVGRGTFGVVRISHKKKSKSSDQEELYAVKEFKRRPNEDPAAYSKRLTSEFCISSSLKHVNIIETLDLLQDAKGDYVEVMQFCSGGDLYTLIIATGKLEYLEADCFFKQLIRGVNYMHEMGITHRDLKPENLLLTSDGCLKITDFGNGECFKMAWEDEIHLSNGICGSSPYIAPEEYVAEEFDPRMVDIWSCGVIYMAMRIGRHLWKEANVKDEFYKKYLEDRKSKKGYEPIEMIKRARCRNVIYSILDPVPSRRINGKQILNSEWGREIKCCH